MKIDIKGFGPNWWGFFFINILTYMDHSHVSENWSPRYNTEEGSNLKRILQKW